MRISDWSSDVCSSDLGRRLRRTVNERELAPEDGGWIDGPAPQPEANSLPFFGRLAEFAVVLVELLVRAPVTLDPIAATTLPVPALTDWLAMAAAAQYPPDELRVSSQQRGRSRTQTMPLAAPWGGRGIP